jgi:hypothetical protein
MDLGETWVKAGVRLAQPGERLELYLDFSWDSSLYFLLFYLLTTSASPQTASAVSQTSQFHLRSQGFLFFYLHSPIRTVYYLAKRMTGNPRLRRTSLQLTPLQLLLLRSHHRPDQPAWVLGRMAHALLASTRSLITERSPLANRQPDATRMTPTYSDCVLSPNLGGGTGGLPRIATRR